MTDIYRKYRISRDDIYLFNTGEAQEAYRTLGCHYVSELSAHRFAVWAPNARSVSVVGDFNAWDAEKNAMERMDGGVFVTAIGGLSDGDCYKYAVTGANGSVCLKADPFAFYSELRPNTASRIWDIGGFCWTDAAYIKRRAAADLFRSPINIYELNIGSFRHKDGGDLPSVRELADEIAAYVRDMGYTHVELMPITEYPLDMSWGYQVTGYFAPTSRYGTPQDYMYFIDRLHSAGIGVIMDWVPAHFPKDAHGLARFDGSCLYEHADPRRAEHPQWGTLIFDYSRTEVVSFLVSSAVYFAEMYHIDGIRMDAVTSMLYLDYARDGDYPRNREGGNIDLDAVEFIKKVNSVLDTRYAGFMTVAEESTAYPLVTRPPRDGGLGFTFKWNMGFMHDTLDYMQTDPLFRSGRHDKLTFSMFYCYSENFILPYSHDEVVHGKRSMVDKMFGDYWQKFASLRALYGYMYAHPGKKLMFMGCEFAQFIEWNENIQLDWFLLQYPSHSGMRDYVRELNELYSSKPALWQTDDSWDGFKWLTADDSANSVVAFMRIPADEDAEHIVCAVNFTPVVHRDYRIGMLGRGVLKLLLNGDEERFGGSGVSGKRTVLTEKGRQGEFDNYASVTLPPLCAQYFTFAFEPEKQAQAIEEKKK